MRWVYILQCEDRYFYVGETSRLYRRFWEHQDGLGGLNTSIYNPINKVIHKDWLPDRFLLFCLYASNRLYGDILLIYRDFPF